MNPEIINLENVFILLIGLGASVYLYRKFKPRPGKRKAGSACGSCTACSPSDSSEAPDAQKTP